MITALIAILISKLLGLDSSKKSEHLGWDGDFCKIYVYYNRPLMYLKETDGEITAITKTEAKKLIRNGKRRYYHG